MVVVEGKLTGKGRPRFFRGHAVTPKSTREYEKLVREEYKKQCDVKFNSDVPISAHITFYKQVPTSYSKRREKAIQGGYESFMGKPDIDNMIKIIFDALNGVAYEDDKQIIKINATKKFTFEEERAEIEIKEYRERG